MVAAICAALFLLSRQPAFARVPGDPQYPLQSAMWNQVNAPAGWDYSIGSRTVVVALIDTGADITNPDIAENIWQNDHEIAGNGIDDDHNGYVDDMHGWNFVDDNNDVRGQVSKGDDPTAVNHGTILAGLLGAVGENGRDGVGINWQVRIMPLRTMDSKGAGSFLDVIKAVRYAIDNGANVIAMSFVGETKEDELYKILREAYDRGIVVVAAAGNDRGLGKVGDLDQNPLYPICFDKGQLQNWLIGVTSVDENSHLSSFANYGSCVDLVAPGEGIYSTQRLEPSQGFTLEFGGKWMGTSFSVPFIAGAAALIKSMHPEWTPSKIINTIMTTADDVEPLNPGFAGKLGYGRLNLGKALALAAATPSVNIGESLYYYKTNKVYRFDLNSLGNYPVVTVADGKITDLSPGMNNQVIVLVKKGTQDLVRIYTADGELDKEFMLPANGQVVGLEMAPSGHIIVERFGPKTGLRRFEDYSLSGEKMAGLTLKANVISWRLDRDTGDLILAEMVKSKLTLRQIDWEGSEVAVWSLDKVDKLYDWASGFLWGAGRGSQIVMIVGQGKAVRQLTVDLNSGSYTKDELGKLKSTARWKVWLEDGNKQINEILRYDPAGGSFPLFTANKGTDRMIKMPKLY